MLTLFKQSAFAKWIAATLFVATTAGALSACVVETAPHHRYYHHDRDYHGYHRGY